MIDKEDEERKKRLDNINRLFGNSSNIVNNNDNSIYEQRKENVNRLFGISSNNSNNTIKKDELKKYLSSLNNKKSSSPNQTTLTTSDAINESYNATENEDNINLFDIGKDTINQMRKASKEAKDVNLNTINKEVKVSPTVNESSNSNFRNSNNSLIKSNTSNSNIKVATAEESENVKEASNTDMYVLSEGNVDRRNNTERTIDSISGVVGNFSEGIEDFLPSVVDYTSAGTELGAKYIAKTGLKILGYSEEEAEKISSDIKEKFNELSPLSLLNTLLNNEQSEQQRNERIRINTLKASDNPFAKKLAELAPSVGSNITSMGITAINPVAGMASFMLSAGGSYLDDARDRGMTDEQAFGYATVMGALEGGTEYIISGNMVDKIGRTFIGKGLSDEVLNSFGVSVAENFFQEAIMDPLQEGFATLFGGDDAANWDNIWQRSLESGIDGMLSAIILGGASVGIASAENVVNKANPTSNDYNQAIIDTINSGKVDVKEIVEGAKQAIISNEGMEHFYSATYNQDGNVENIQSVQGKQIENLNKNINISPVIIKNSQSNSYNVIDKDTGILLDSSQYQTLIEAQTEFDRKIGNLDNASIKNINNKIAQANITIKQEIAETQSKINADQFTNVNVINATENGQENVMNSTQTDINNVNVNPSNANQINANSSNVNTNIDTNASANTESYTNIDDNAYQASQNQLTDEINNNTQNYISNNANSVRNQNNGLNEVSKLMIQISDNSIYGRERTSQVFETVTRNIPSIELQVNDNGTYLNSLDRNGNVVYQQEIPNRMMSGGEIRDIVNNAINNADLSKINIAQTNENQFRNVSNNGTANYTSQNTNENVGQNNEETTPAMLHKNVNNMLFEQSPSNNSITQTDKLNQALDTFRNARGNVSRDVVLTIADNLNIKIKDGSQRITDTEMSKRAGHNKKPKIVEITELFKDVTNNNAKTYRNEAINEAMNRFRDKEITIKDTKTIAEINKSGIEKTFSGSVTESKIQTADNLDNIIEEGIYDYSTQNTNSKDGIIYHHFFAPVEYKGNNGLIRVVIKEYTQNKTANDKFYYHQLEYINNKKIEGMLGTLPRKAEVRNFKPAPSTNTSISQNNSSVKNNTNATNKSMQNNKNNTTRSEKVNNIQKSNDNGIRAERTSKNNIIDNLMNNIIENEKDNFRSNIKIKTSIVDETSSIPLNYNKVGQSTLSNIAKKLFNEIHKKVLNNNSEKIYVTNSDINESIAQTLKNSNQKALLKENISVFSQLDKIVENAKEIKSSDISVADNKGRSQYSDYKYYYTNVYIDGDKAWVQFDTRVQKGTTGKSERHFRLERIYKINEVDSNGGTDNSITHFSNESTSTKSIPQNKQNVKDNGIRVERTSNTAEYDNQGNRLTKAQRDFFKDSKVRDENGKLKVVYHGTNNEFTIFDRNKSGQSNSNAKIGFWFTETKEGARKFAESVWYGNKKNSEVFEVYLDIKNPKIYKSIDNSKELNTLEEKMTDLKQKIRQIENRNINIEINSSAIRYASDEAELIDIAEQNGIIKRQDEFVSTAQEYKKLLNDYDNTEREYNNKRYNDAYELFRTDIYKVAGKDANDANFGGTGMWLENESEILQKYKSNLEKQGYDGIIIQGTNYDSETMGRNNTQYVVFNSNQIKNVTNTSPTSNPDIRYENTNNVTSQPYNSRSYEENEGLMKYLNENEYLKTLMEIDEKQGETYAHSADRLIEQEIRKLEETNGFDNSIPVTKLTDIDREIENYLGKTIGKGHFRQRARGIYNSETDKISVKEYKDLDNVFHELGHALDLGGRIKVDKASLSDELLAAIKRHGGYENETIGVQLDEGFAEVLKTYAINKDIVKQDYPKSYKVLEDFKASNVEFGKFITKLQEDTYNYIHQSPRNRELSNQSIGEQTDKETITIEKIARKAVKTVYDSNYEVKRMQEEFSKATGHKPTPSQNAYLLTRLASGVDNKIVSMLTNGYVDESGKRLMPGLNRIGKILGNNPERINDLRTYLVARRDLEYKAKTLKTGLRTMDSKAIIEQFYNDAQIQEAAQIIYDTLDGVLQYAVDNGLITKENAKNLRESNVFYVPFQRVIQGRGNQVGRRGAVSDIVKQRTGSELDIKDVLENIVTNSANIIKQVENNNILRAVYEQGKETGMKNNVFDVIPTPMKKIGTAQLSTWESELKKQGIDTSKLVLTKTLDMFVPNNNIITENDGSHIVSFFDKNGNRKYLQFYKESTDIFNSLMGLDRNANSMFLKIMRKMNMPLRYGATMANVGFAIPNMISDTIQASIFSEAGFIPVVDNVLGVLDVLGATNNTVRNFLNQVAPQYAERINRLYDIYQQTGATSSMRMAQYRESAQEIMQNIYGTKNSEALGIKESFKPLKRLMDILTYIPELSESSTRFRVFERNYNAYINKGMSETDARIQAAIESRDATQDFGRTGTLTREINQLIPFSAARVGGAYTFAERVKANPKRVMARTAILLTVAMLIKAVGYDDDEIEELNQRKKDDNFVFKIGDTVTTIKKPQGILRSMINLVEYVQDLATGHIEEGKEGERLVEWTTNAIMDNMPADSITGLVPNAIAPVVENAINKDFYYNTDIVKSWDLDLPDEQQYYDYTSQLAIWLGQVFNYSPAKIDNLISGYLGGLGTQLTNTIDWISGSMGFSAEEPAMGAEDNAIGKRFVVNVNENSASVDEIYSREEELTKKLNGGTITEEENAELENIKAGISKLSALNKQIKAIKQDLTMSGEEKAEAIRPLQEQKTDVARQALGKNPIYTENTDDLEALEFYPSRSTLSYNGLTLNLTEDMKTEYMNIAYELYKKYQNQGLYSGEYLETLKSKVKDATKKEMLQKYKNQLVKGN